jgi:hypothetical protein
VELWGLREESWAILEIVMVTFNAHFDGKVIVPDEPVDLRPNEALIVQVRSVEEEKSQGRALDWIAANAIDSDVLPEDLSLQHDHYLYGRPKAELDG